MNILLTNIQITFIFKENMWNQFFFKYGRVVFLTKECVGPKA